MRCWFLIFGWICFSSTIGEAQIKEVYSGKSILINNVDGIESFEFQWKDSVRVPSGKYTFKSSRETQEIHELILIQANFAGGVPHGYFELDHYSFKFSILDFDRTGIQTANIGEKIIIQGSYDRGQPIGKWQIQVSNLEDSTQLQQMNFDYSNRKWMISRDDINLEGRVDLIGRFEGLWKYKPGSQTTVQMEYQNGILTAMKLGEESLFKEVFDQENRLLKGEEKLNIYPSPDPWIWQPGLEQSHPLLSAQDPLALFYTQAFNDYNGIEDLQRMDHLFKFPPISGTSLVYHPMDSLKGGSLSSLIGLIETRDSLLEDWLTLPVFILRRSTNSVCDSLMSIGEDLQQEGQQLKQAINYFLSDEARIVSPYQMNLLDQGSFGSHQQIADNIIAYNDSLESVYTSLASSMSEKQEILRLHGTLEEYEEEWYLLYQEIVELQENFEHNQVATKVFDRFILQDFESRQSEYGQNLPLLARQEFLQETIGYYRYFLSYFKTESYLNLTEYKEYFTEAYTQFLYNPYMGVDNVEVVAKKRFLLAVLTYFWPHKLKGIDQCEDGMAYRDYHSSLMKIRQFLTDFAIDKGKSARRLERKVRKSTDPEEMEMLLIEYMNEHWGEDEQR